MRSWLQIVGAVGGFAVSILVLRWVSLGERRGNHPDRSVDGRGVRDPLGSASVAAPLPITRSGRLLAILGASGSESGSNRIIER